VKVGESKVVDIRKDSEYSMEHVDEAYSKPLANINEWIKDIDPKAFYLHCAGYRSMIAAILQARGFRNFSEIEGGFNAITKLQYQPPIFCQSKTL
jgi:rhodanese-related sulfurtransferase